MTLNMIKVKMGSHNSEIVSEKNAKPKRDPVLAILLINLKIRLNTR